VTGERADRDTQRGVLPEDDDSVARFSLLELE
jgi:hypothetical protein